MRLGNERVGPWGICLLALTGLVGAALAAQGYGHGAVIAGPVGAIGASRPAASPPGTSTVTPTPRPTPSTVPSTPSTRAPNRATSAPTGVGAQKLGPLLSATQYAQYAYQLYPGRQSSQARLATAGFNVRVTRLGDTITVTVAASGAQQNAQTTNYPAGDHVYFIEATFGDDSGDTDYNFGDDGIIVTNSEGRIIE
jgi:hypothetical protein